MMKEITDIHGSEANASFIDEKTYRYMIVAEYSPAMFEKDDGKPALIKDAKPFLYTLVDLDEYEKRGEEKFKRDMCSPSLKVFIMKLAVMNIDVNDACFMLTPNDLAEVRNALLK